MQRSDHDESFIDRDDPIFELWKSVCIYGCQPPISWVVKYGKGRRDPVVSAWKITKQDVAMRELLRSILPSDLLYNPVDGYDLSLICKERCGYFPCDACCRKIRRSVRAPTMRDVFLALEAAK